VYRQDAEARRERLLVVREAAFGSHQQMPRRLARRKRRKRLRGAGCEHGRSRGLALELGEPRRERHGRQDQGHAIAAALLARGDGDGDGHEQREAHQPAAGIARAGSLDTEALIAAFRGLEYDSPIGRIRIRAGDHQATVGNWIGTLGQKDGRGVVKDWTFLDGANYLPPEAEARARRPAGAND